MEETERIYCNWCQRETNHVQKGEHYTIFGQNEPLAYGESYGYKLWICMGCDHGVLEQKYQNEDMPEGYAAYTYHPERSHESLLAKEYYKLPLELRAIYRETILAFNSKAIRLSGAGLRALLEGICQDKKVKGRNLKTKIEGLQSFLPNKTIVRNLHQFRFMGNEAIHELAYPKASEVKLAISVIEDLMSFLYELDYKASQLREMRRANKKKLKLTKKLSDSANHGGDNLEVVAEPPVEPPKPETV